MALTKYLSTHEGQEIDDAVNAVNSAVSDGGVASQNQVNTKLSKNLTAEGTIVNTGGDPAVTINVTGTDEAPELNFVFDNIQGAVGLSALVCNYTAVQNKAPAVNDALSVLASNFNRLPVVNDIFPLLVQYSLSGNLINSYWVSAIVMAVVEEDNGKVAHCVVQAVSALGDQAAQAYKQVIEASQMAVDTTATPNYAYYVITASTHGQMTEGVLANDLWISVMEVSGTTDINGASPRYSIASNGDVTVYTSQPTNLVVRIWNGITGKGPRGEKGEPAENPPTVTKVSVVDFVPPSSLAEATWEQIDQLSRAGIANQYFNIGDEKNITVTEGAGLPSETTHETTLVILGFNHDDLSSGGKAGITFGMKNLLTYYYKMNNTNTSAGSWKDSLMRTTTMLGLYGHLPEEVKSVIKPVNKLTSVGSLGGSTETTSDTLFLLSEVEVFNTSSYAVAGEGSQYAYYQDIANTAALREKKLTNGTGSAETWWLRSPNKTNPVSFCEVSSGEVQYATASTSYGVSFAFCV